jgi:hypothetical protein
MPQLIHPPRRPRRMRPPMPRGLRGRLEVRTLRGMRSARAVSLPPPLQPKQEQEAPKKDNTNYIPAAMPHEVREERSFHLHLPVRPRGTAAAGVLALGGITTPRPFPPRERP